MNWRNLVCEKLHNLYSSSDVVRVNLSRRMKETTWDVKQYMAESTWSGSERNTTRMIGLDLCGSRQGPMASCNEGHLITRLASMKIIVL